jgi:hypothetical protein
MINLAILWSNGKHACHHTTEDDILYYALEYLAFKIRYGLHRKEAVRHFVRLLTRF